VQAIEKTAKTIQEAVEKALEELGIAREDAEIEVLEEPSKGLFGLLGAKPARVRIGLRNTTGLRAKELLGTVLDAMSIDADIKINEQDENVHINLEGSDLGVLIGRRGETLDALQYLVSLSVNKNQERRKKIFLDVEGYRKRREDTQQKLALKLADKARQRGRNVVLEPMNSLERRIIHTALQGRDDIATFSEGEEPYRKIIIAPKK
jgi:spoIIIJ-associated protein